MSGIDVRDTGDYMLLLTEAARDVAEAVPRGGYRSVAVMPGMRSPWPEGAFYGFDAIHGELELEYRGPSSAGGEFPISSRSRASPSSKRATSRTQPLLTFFPTINTHIPFLPVPPYQADWQRVLEAEPLSAQKTSSAASPRRRIGKRSAVRMPSRSSTRSRISPAICASARGRRRCSLIGDHQPAASVAGVGARWDVPVHVITRHADVAEALLAAGFVEGVALAPQQRPIATMPELSALLLTTFAAPP